MSETLEKVQKTTKSKKDLSGIWRLTYKLTNRMEAAGFSGRNLVAYIDAVTGRERHLYDLNGNLTNGYFIERQTTLFYPDENPDDANTLDWLLGHDLIFVEQKHASLDSRYIKAKDSNPRITLVNLDYQDVEDLDEEDYIDKLIGVLSLDAGQNAIGLKKLRFILAALNMEYRLEKFGKDESVEKSKLRKKLKDYVRRGREQADEVNKILEDLTGAQYEWEIKEMIRLGILSNHGGMFKYEGVALGITTESVIKYFKDNTDFYSETVSKMYESLKREK